MLDRIRPAAGIAAVATIAALVMFVLPATPAAANDTLPAPAAAAGRLATWYRTPDSATAVSLVEQELSAELAASAPRRMRLVGFVAGLVATDPAYVDLLAPLFRTLPADQPLRLARAIAYSGRPDWSLHTARLKNLWPEHADAIEALAAKGGRPIPLLAESRNALVVDLAAGYWGATGNPAAIERIIRALPSHRMTQSAEELLVAQAARWYLASAIRSDATVRSIAMAGVDGPHGEPLREILGLPAHAGVRSPTAK